MLNVGCQTSDVFMKRSRFQIFLVIGLLGLLGVSAALQYVWLAQISEAEKDRMSRRLQTDSQRFAEDFNREIQAAYFNFQTDEQLWEKKDWGQFNERYDFWREKTTYPNLIKTFYYFENKPDAPLLQYDAEKHDFKIADWTNSLQTIKTNAARKNDFEPFDEANFALIMPIHETAKSFERIVIRKSTAPDNLSAQTKIDLPEAKSFLVIMLDEAVIKNQILPDLVKKNFPENDFNLAVTDRNDQKFFQTHEVNTPDSSAKIFNLAPNSLLFFASRDNLPRIPNDEMKGVIINQKIQRSSISKIETHTFESKPTDEKSNKTFKIEINDGEKPRTIIQNNETSNGIWTLNIQHSAGSLDQFIAQTRNKNLGISFGILSLLAVTILLIFVSAQRAKLYAQRQIDFVSSVSHEFRTPLAVIYSAGENLADGVAKEENQVSRYGDLIKGEGKKLSKMVEQILDFAGANSGRKKYDLREQNINEIIENALRECQPLIDEKGFTVERQIADNLPPIKADANALSQAIQNLIFNSLKYSNNGEKWLKISARNGDGKVKIAVEDKGIGIAPPDLKHIFEPFYRAKTVVDEQIHGNGLGLSLVKETVAAHGGKISAESEIGKGSKFTIELLNEKVWL